MADIKMPEGLGVAEEADKAADPPFDFTAAGVDTALLCEPDHLAAEMINRVLTGMGFRVTAASSAKEAIQRMRFHVYNLVVINESFDTDNPDANEVLAYLENLPMSTRRRMFVALIGTRFHTSDYFTALNKSVNVTINTLNMEDLETILKSGIRDTASFYHIFKDTMAKLGRI